MTNRDPVCGMKGTIPKYGHYFCSKHCIKVYEGQEQNTSKTPVIILISMLIAAVVLSIVVEGFMQPFMGIFFIIVAGLKLLDINGFIMGFRQYDVLAQKLPFYARAYPFLELALGILFLTDILPGIAAIATVVIMTEGLYSVGKALAQKRKLKCACLGSLIAVPLTTFTLLEDVIMLGMALVLFL